MIIKTPGTVNFWFTPDHNPMAFIEGNNVFWTQFKIDNEQGVIISEGETLVVILNQNTSREISVFKTKIKFDLNIKHMITVTWNQGSINLFFDGEMVQSVDPIVM